MENQESSVMIKDAFSKRKTTDMQMSGLWMLMPFLGIIIMTIGIFLGMVGSMFSADTITYDPYTGQYVYTAGDSTLAIIGWALVAVGAILSLLVMYKLLWRREEHFKRAKQLREGLVEYLKTKSDETGNTDVSTMQSIHSEINTTEPSRSPIIYTILVIIPLVNLYVIYVLLKEITSHDHKELEFYKLAQSLFSKSDTNVVIPTWNPLPPRSAGLYVILSLIIPFFSLYVLWILIKDPDMHFQFHQKMEEALEKVKS
jgi:hypothetical protein